MKGSNELQINSRKLTGKKSSRKLARESKIPAVFYHKAEGNMSLEIDHNVFQKFMNTKHGIIELVIDGKEKKQAFVKKVQFDPVKDVPMHIDFQGVTAGESIRTDVSVVLIGEAIGLKSGGFMEHSLRSISIECLPKNLPDHIVVDVSQLELGQSLHVSDLNLKDIKLHVDPEELICHVEIPKVQEEEVTEEVDELEESAEPEVLKQKDTEEE
ncbi:MAG: 50S ribosomal protein L25 [Calditrichia bacterium]|nr:50S ribosomal protein L25 [Calditrichia bacterium]